MDSGQIIIFHQPRFPWNVRGFPFQLATEIGGPGRVFGRYNFPSTGVLHLRLQINAFLLDRQSRNFRHKEL